MKLWLDDIRPAPEGWYWARSAQAAIGLLSTGEVTHISLDYDLDMVVAGQRVFAHDDEPFMLAEYSDVDAPTGGAVADWILSASREGRIGPLVWTLHTMNAAGRQQMQAALSEAEQYWI